MTMQDERDLLLERVVDVSPELLFKHGPRLSI